jgi:hypothetical protein
MADTKISQMPEAATLDGTEIAPLVQSGSNVQQSLESIVTQTFQVTPNIGLNTTNVNSYGEGWTTLTIGGANTNNAQPSGGEIDLVSTNGTSHVELFYDEQNFEISNTGTGSIIINSPTNITLGSPVKTSTLTGYLYGNNTSGVVTASTTIPASSITGQQYAEIYVTGASASQTTSATPNAYTQLTAFTTNGNANGATPVASSDKITITQAGIYQVTMTCTFTASNNHTFAFRVYNSTTSTAYANTNVKNHTQSTDPHTFTITALINVGASQDIIIQVTSTQASQPFVISDADFAVIKIG